MTHHSKQSAIRSIYLVTFLTAVHYAFIVYINSSYLEKYVSKESLGVLYTIASLFSIFIISDLSSILKRFGQFKTVLTVLLIDFLATAILALTSSPLLSQTSVFKMGDFSAGVPNTSSIVPFIPVIVVLAFLTFQIAIVLNRILLDVYLEEFSKDKETGSNRGWFLTSMNLAFVLSPIIVGWFITKADQSFWPVYLTSALFILASTFLIIRRLHWVKDIDYHSPPLIKTFKKITKDKNIFSIFMSSFLLEFFYSWMVVYTPIYLNEVIGFSWSQIGAMFSIMLTAFVIFQLPLGKLADKYIGEKEILTAGFVVIALATGSLTFLRSTSFLIWALALFCTRVGASAIEIMNDTYFFKKVKATDSDIISFFRTAGPMAYIFGPIMGSVAIYFTGYRYLFFLLGIIMALGIKFSLAIRDTL